MNSTCETQKGAQDDRRWRMTTKGWLVVELDGRMDVWDKLVEHVSKTADANGITEGVPCLVLEGGGHCIRVIPKASEADSVQKGNAVMAHPVSEKKD